MTRSLKQAIQANRQRTKYRILRNRLLRLFYEYEDRGPAALARYRRVLRRVAKRIPKPGE